MQLRRDISGSTEVQVKSSVGYSDFLNINEPLILHHRLANKYFTLVKLDIGQQIHLSIDCFNNLNNKESGLYSMVKQLQDPRVRTTTNTPSKNKSLEVKNVHNMYYEKGIFLPQPLKSLTPTFSLIFPLNKDMQNSFNDRSKGKAFSLLFVVVSVSIELY